MSRLALFDIGNTAIKAASCTGTRLHQPVSYLNRNITPDRLFRICRKYSFKGQIDAALACCVAPEQGAALKKAWGSASSVPLIFINHKMDMPVNLKYPLPATIGTDRLAAAAASYSIVKGEHIVVSIGTAVTCDCIDSKGRFLGGSISAGPGLLLDCLADRTGLLPRIEFSVRIPSIGRSTEGAMKIGAGAGFAGMLNGIISHLESGAFAGRTVPLILTGGYADQVGAMLSRKCRIVHGLALRGLAIIYRMNF